MPTPRSSVAAVLMLVGLALGTIALAAPAQRSKPEGEAQPEWTLDVRTVGYREPRTDKEAIDDDALKTHLLFLDNQRLLIAFVRFPDRSKSKPKASDKEQQNPNLKIVLLDASAGTRILEREWAAPPDILYLFPTPKRRLIFLAGKTVTRYSPELEKLAERQLDHPVIIARPSLSGESCILEHDIASNLTSLLNVENLEVTDSWADNGTNALAGETLVAATTSPAAKSHLLLRRTDGSWEETSVSLPQWCGYEPTFVSDHTLVLSFCTGELTIVRTDTWTVKTEELAKYELPEFVVSAPAANRFALIVEKRKGVLRPYFEADRAAVYDSQTLQVIWKRKLTPSRHWGPSGLAISPDGKRLAVMLKGKLSVHVIQ